MPGKRIYGLEPAFRTGGFMGQGSPETGRFNGRWTDRQQKPVKCHGCHHSWRLFYGKIETITISPIIHGGFSLVK
jgi:hypothetical protein